MFWKSHCSRSCKNVNFRIMVHLSTPPVQKAILLDKEHLLHFVCPVTFPSWSSAPPHGAVDHIAHFQLEQCVHIPQLASGSMAMQGQPTHPWNVTPWPSVHSENTVEMKNSHLIHSDILYSIIKKLLVKILNWFQDLLVGCKTWKKHLSTDFMKPAFLGYQVRWR